MVNIDSARTVRQLGTIYLEQFRLLHPAYVDPIFYNLYPIKPLFLRNF